MESIQKVAASLAFVLLGSLSTGLVYGLEIFSGSFAKNESGPVEYVADFNALAGAAAITFTNGGPSGELVKQGRISLNGQPLFGTQDFKILGSILKQVSLLPGANTLAIELSGQIGGRLTLTVNQGPDQPVLEFPARTIFVEGSLGTDDFVCGVTKQSPCRSIGFGIVRAAQIAGPAVAVANGVYHESLGLVAGISVLGGYDDQFSRRDIANMRPVLRGHGASPATVQAVNINLPTMFEGFLVLGPTVTTPSANSIAVLVRNSRGGLSIRNNIIVAGVGAGGAVGSHGGDGMDGAPGGVGRGGGNSGGLGGQGGRATVLGDDISGGAGGNSATPVFDALNGSGAAGQFANPAGGGAGGSGGSGGASMRPFGSCSLLEPPAASIHGVDGGNGAHGANGASGAGGDGGELVSELWRSASGSAGGPGGNGGGGGGGGAGGGTEGSTTLGCATYFGPSGGGGGSGAGGGAAGGGGGGGGAAFGIFVSVADASSPPIIEANQIYLGIGGPGGNGGNGGAGGFGALGGIAGPSISLVGGLAVTGNGGRGGSGGNGGQGAGGGGGAGGPSVGLAANFEYAPYLTSNAISADIGVGGAGGAGGLSFGNPGAAGQAGGVSAVRWLTP